MTIWFPRNTRKAQKIIKIRSPQRGVAATKQNRNRDWDLFEWRFGGTGTDTLFWIQCNFYKVKKECLSLVPGDLDGDFESGTDSTTDSIAIAIPIAIAIFRTNRRQDDCNFTCELTRIKRKLQKEKNLNSGVRHGGLTYWDFAISRLDVVKLMKSGAAKSC